MTKADWLALAGYVLIASGMGFIYWPLGVLCAGYFCVRLARAAAADTSPANAAPHIAWQRATGASE